MYPICIFSSEFFHQILFLFNQYNHKFSTNCYQIVFLPFVKKNIICFMFGSKLGFHPFCKIKILFSSSLVPRNKHNSEMTWNYKLWEKNLSLEQGQKIFQRGKLTWSRSIHPCQILIYLSSVFFDISKCLWQFLL